LDLANTLSGYTVDIANNDGLIDDEDYYALIAIDLFSRMPYETGTIGELVAEIGQADFNEDGRVDTVGDKLFFDIEGRQVAP